MDGFRLKEMISRSPYSYAEVEKMTGIKRATLNRWANNSVLQIPLEESIKICEALNIDTAEIFDPKKTIEEDRRLLKSMIDVLNTLEGSERIEQEKSISILEESIKDSEFLLSLNDMYEKNQAGKSEDLSADEQHFLQEFRKLSSEAQENVTRILQIVSTLPEDQQQKVSELVLTVLNTKGLL